MSVTTAIRRSFPVVLVTLFLGAGLAAAQTDESAPAPVPEWRDVTLTDTHGWDYRGVTIRWIEGGRRLEIVRADGATRSFAPGDVARVRDADGRDITVEVAAARDGSPPPPAPDGSVAVPGAGPDPVVDTTTDPEFGTATGGAWGATLAELVTPPLFSVAWDAALGYATNTGSWFTGLDDGVNYQAGLRVTVSPRTWLRFVFRRQDLGTVRVGYDYDLNVPVEAEFNLNEFMFMVGRPARLIERSSLRSLGYVEFGFSIMDHRARLVDYAGVSTNETKMGLGLNGGVLILLDSGFAADLSATVTWKPGLSENEGGGLLLGARAGIAVMF